MKNHLRTWIAVASILCIVALLFLGYFLLFEKRYDSPERDSEVGNTLGGTDELPLSGPLPDARVKRLSAVDIEPQKQEEQQSLMPVGSPQDSGGLPFEEQAEDSLNASVGLVDFAIVQAMKRMHLPVSGITVLNSKELDDSQGQRYTFKNLEIVVGDNPSQFIQVLRDCLIAWAEHAVLESVASQDTTEVRAWRIVVQGVPTHELSLKVTGLDAAEQPMEPTAAPPVAATGPLLAIVIDDMGESRLRLQQFMDLHIPLTIAIWPYAGQAQYVAERAHAGGLQVILHQPMEPLGYPKVNPGKGVLLRNMPRDQQLSIVESNLARIPHVSGLNNHMGSALTQDEKAMYAIASLLKKKKLLVLDSLTHGASRFSKAGVDAGAVTYRRDVFLDDDPREASVLQQLHRAERVALANKQAIAIGHPYDSTLSALRQWLTTRDKRITLVVLRNAVPLSKH